tara:strand:+ start:298 stop:786 length:489 start_codon:yes stop_codon:yes gene_type:complete
LNIKIAFSTVTSEHYEFLYEILEQRFQLSDIIKGDMSSLPSYDDHVSYLSSLPHKYHVIAHVEGIDMGTMYINHQDEIGIYIHQDQKKQFIKQFGKPRNFGAIIFLEYLETYLPSRFNGKASLSNIPAIVMNNKMLETVTHIYNPVTWQDDTYKYYECTRKN